MSKLVEDLSARSRRGELDEADEKRLEQMLAASVQSRLLHRAGLEIDREDCVLPGDDALAERIARRLLVPPAPPRRRRSGRLLVAAALLTTGAAAAGAGPIVVRSVQAFVGIGSRTDAVVLPSRPKDVAKPPRQPAPARSPVAPVVPSSPPEEAPRPAPPGVRAPLTERPRESKAGAAELYAEANRARGAGEPGRAIALYDTLQREHPQSPQSAAVDVPLGILRMQGGASDAAGEHFRRYLSRQPEGPLAPEAWWGLGQVYEKTHRQAEAGRVWAQILERYPDSAYASFARAKLRVDPAQD